MTSLLLKAATGLCVFSLSKYSYLSRVFVPLWFKNILCEPSRFSVVVAERVQNFLLRPCRIIRLGVSIIILITLLFVPFAFFFTALYSVIVMIIRSCTLKG